MRTAFLCLSILGLAMVVNGQDKIVTVGPSIFFPVDNTPPAAILRAREMEVGVVPFRTQGGAVEMKSRVVARGDVEIRIGESLISADEAEVLYGGFPGEPDDVELRGDVRLRTHLKVER